MSKNPAETLKALFAIEQSAIDRDLRKAEGRLLEIVTEISALLALPTKTSETDARVAHLWMIQAHELCRLDKFATELKTFHAAFGASQIAQDASGIAADKDTCAEISARMKLICQREGLPEGEFWVMRSEGPKDYQDLNAEFEQILRSVEDTVFTFLLRRYDLNNYAELFEQDRVSFEIQREIGRRISMPVQEEAIDIEALMDDYFLKQYGADALAHVQSRTVDLQKKHRAS